ncbi:MAG: nickel pincer cofactor biosynthesis protein LarC [Oscillospiraceae bacterium]|nr:nickel pincer cofactor biosynthesis protein LarC [Oscillospiraceae bacterium]
MKTLYLDLGMGAAGDMLTAALLELLPDRAAFVEKLNALGIPGVRYAAETAEKCGIQGTHMRVTVAGEEEDEHLHEHHDHAYPHEHEHAHEHQHEHHHDHASEEHAHPHTHAHDHDHEHSHEHEHHHHHHSGMHEIEHIVWDLHLPEQVEQDVLAVYGLIAEAESHAHGMPVTEIHFHEVGTMDAVADVVAVCLLLHEIAPDEIVASPVHVGSGQVRCAHGILPVPAPATAYILRDVPIYGGAIQGELCTPTGAALLRHFVTRFGEMPVLRVRAIGYGMGKKDFERANCVRALLGETEGAQDQIAELDCNVDDMSAEAMGFAMEQLLAAGAREVFAQSVTMKKSRPGTLLTVLCSPEDRQRMAELLLRYTTTIGVRESLKSRYVLARSIETLDTPYGPVRIKRSEGYGVIREKLEYEDLARIAREQGVSLREAEKLVKESAQR